MRSVALVLVLLVACSHHANRPPADTGGLDISIDPGDYVVSSFVFFGGCRVSKSDLDPTNNPSSANLPELDQTLADLDALADTPRYWFFVGDLVDGLQSGSTTLQTQLAAWADLYHAAPVSSKLDLVPVSGNHEMLYKTNKMELSNASADGVWTSWLATNGFAKHAGNGPSNAPPNADALQDDQGALTYSFDDGGAHYVVLDTDSWTTTPDPATSDTQIGWIALQWLTQDLAAAQANPSITGIYLFGHKPLIHPSGATDSADAINPALAPAMEQLLDQTPKVKGYFTSHAHLWMTTQLPGRGVFQVIAGNGGSALESSWTEPNPYFGFTVVKTYASGKVGVVSYRRPAPTPYNAPTSTAATPVAEIVIAP